VGAPLRAAAASLVGLIAIAVVAASAAAVPTHAEYVDRVNPICKRAAQAVSRIPKKIRPSGDPGFDAYRAGLLFSKILGRTTRKIAAVDPPGEDAQAVRAWIDGLRQQKRLTDRSLRAAKNGRVGQSAALGQRVAKLEDRNARRASALGLPACARSG
jgi:hypothetical protein